MTQQPTLWKPLAVVVVVTTVDTLIELFDSNGNSLASNDDIVLGVDTCSRITHSFTPGMYFVEVRGFDGDEGSYTLGLDN